MNGTEPLREPEQLAGVPLPEMRDAVVGHSDVVDEITASLAAGRLPAAILLHGPRGIGKATLSFQLTRLLFERTGDEPPHRVAEQVRALSHPNLHVLRRQPKEGKGFYGAIRVDEVRALRERLRRTAGRKGHRVAVLDSIDDCNPNAANALLKLLEEPPPEVLFLLVSHRPGQLLPTIRSRCWSLAVRPLPDADVASVLRHDFPDAGEAALDSAVSLANGRPRRGVEALALSDETALTGLRDWLRQPEARPAGEHLALADALAAGALGTEYPMARDVVVAWMAREAREAALDRGDRRRLASACALWEKASDLFLDADTLNLDVRLTLTAILDAIRKHRQSTLLSVAQ